MTGKINQLLKPTKQKVILFIIFMLIVVAGQIQSYAFTNGEITGKPKPVFYDLLKPFPFWALWMYLLLPLSPIHLILSATGLRVNSIFLLTNVVYFYILASFMAFCYEKYRPKFTTKFWGIWITVAIVLNFLSYGISFILMILGKPVLFSEGTMQGFVTGLVMGVLVTVFYGYTISCAFFLIRDRIKSSMKTTRRPAKS